MKWHLSTLYGASSLLCVLLAAGPYGCARQQPVDVPSGTLIVVPAAKEVRRTSEYDGAIHYVVNDPYPAEVTTAYIESAMRKAGWHASDSSLLRLDRTDGGRTWWSYFQQRETQVYQWDAGWSNGDGDLATYLLRYEVSPPNAVARRLLVSALYTRASTVKKMRDELNVK